MTTAPVIVPYGPGALLVDTPGRNPVVLAEHLRDLPGVIDTVPGAATVLLTFATSDFSEAEAMAHFAAAVRKAWAEAAEDPEPDPQRVVIPVRYDGEDLPLVAERAAMTIEDVIECHSRPEYRVAFTGFAPGFGYLSELNEALHLPRLDSPRASVPAGSVAIAGEYAAVYPRSSPGGWLLLGRTEMELFDTDAEPPALLRPGAIVKFEPR